MSYRNVLCVDNRCNSPSGCFHRGPQGQHCWFYAEQKLCEILNISWYPQLELDGLLSKIQDKLALLPSEEDYAAQIELAKKQPQPALQIEEEETK